MSKSSKRSNLRRKREASLPEGTTRKKTFLSGRALVFGGFLIATVISIYAWSHAQKAQPKATSSRQVTAQELAALGKTNFGQFPANTEAERELEKMLRGKDEDIDLGLVDWLVVSDIPQFAGLTREAYFQQLEAMTEQVRRDMARRAENARAKGKNPNDPDIRCAIFCGSVAKLGIDYIEEFAQRYLTPLQSKGLYADAHNVFLAGLLTKRRGSCVSMPMIFLAIGQRLGFPVHLVFVGNHCFIRWEEPGFRLNIETTRVDKTWVTSDDSAFAEEMGLTMQQVSGRELQNLSNKEVIGNLLFIRASHWVMSTEKARCKSWVDLSRAIHLSPGDPAIIKTCNAVFGEYQLKPEHTLADFKAIEAKLLEHEAMVASLNDQPGIPPQRLRRTVQADGQLSPQQPDLGVDAVRRPSNLDLINQRNRTQPGAIRGLQPSLPGSRPGQ